MYKSRPIAQVIHENINYILQREKLTKELIKNTLPEIRDVPI